MTRRGEADMSGDVLTKEDLLLLNDLAKQYPAVLDIVNRLVDQVEVQQRMLVAFAETVLNKCEP